MWEAKYLKKSAIYCWKSTEIRQKLQFFFICPSLKPHIIQMIKDNSKFQKHGTWFINWLHFLFFNLSSKPHGCPLKEADLETVKVVNFATKWLNLYPRTVRDHIYLSHLWGFQQTYVQNRTRFAKVASYETSQEVSATRGVVRTF